MTIARTIINDLREKRLWPVAAALLVAVIAVPILLSSSSSSTAAPIAQLPSQSGSQPAVKGIPAVAVTNAPSHARINGASRDPFTQRQAGSDAVSTGGGTPVTPIGGTGPTGPTAPGTTTTPTGSIPQSTPTVPGTATTPTIPVGTAPPAPAGLTDTQSYSVGISITTNGGGVNAIDPAERLTMLPSERNPWLIELGVLKGGRRVLFAVQPGTSVEGPGTCTPGPIDCQILALGPNEIETISGDAASASGAGRIVSLPARTAQASAAPASTQFAVTAIRADDHPSVAAADQTRQSESAAGRALLNKSSASALSLFHYDPSIGAVVDLRNVTVGGS